MARAWLAFFISPLLGVLSIWLAVVVVATIGSHSNDPVSGAAFVLGLFLLFGLPIAFVVTAALILACLEPMRQRGRTGPMAFTLVPMLPGAVVGAAILGVLVGPTLDLGVLGPGAALGALGGAVAGWSYWAIRFRPSPGHVDTVEHAA